jgi:hypothetical protein
MHRAHCKEKTCQHHKDSAESYKKALNHHTKEAEALIIDYTEQPIQRPTRKQRCWYSGKK